MQQAHAPRNRAPWIDPAMVLRGEIAVARTLPGVLFFVPPRPDNEPLMLCDGRAMHVVSRGGSAAP